MFKEQLVSFLKWILKPLEDGISALPPSAWVLVCCSVFGLGALGVLFLKHETIYRDAPDVSSWRDLRYWVILLMIPFILLYYFLGRT